MTINRRSLAALQGIVSILICLPGVSTGDTFLVDSFLDSVDLNPGDGVCLDSLGECTLRAAIVESNAFAGADSVRLPAGTYELTIPGAGENNSLQGDLDIRDSLTLESLVPRDALNTIIQQTVVGGVIDLPFIEGVAPVVTLSGLTIMGGNGISAGGGVNSVGLGTILIQDCVITNNHVANGGGGGWRNFGTATMLRSWVEGNSSTGRGGGIYHLGSSLTAGADLMTVRDSTISDNDATHGGGGGINAFGNISIFNSTISGNTTLTGQFASSGAGLLVANEKTAILNNLTVVGNTGTGPETRGGGVGIAQFVADPLQLAGILFIGNSIVAGNMAGGVPSDCAGGTLNSSGYNIVQSDTNCVLGGTGDIVDNPLLMPLAVDTGLTPTHLPTIGGPVVDAGSPSIPGSGGDACEATEQRGGVRPLDGDDDTIETCDIGAVELFNFLIFGQAPASFEAGDFSGWDEVVGDNP